MIADPCIVLTRDQVREVDRRAIADYGIPGIVLMENAGRNAAELIARWVAPEKPIAIVCGGGNNGGDGFVIARHLSNAGRSVRLFLACEPQRLNGDAATNHAIVAKMALPMTPYCERQDIASGQKALASVGAIVDAVLGTGFSGAVRPPLDSVIESINAAGVPVFAIDVPSGMDCETGRSDGPCVRASKTVTFVAQKRGFLEPGASVWAGEIFVVDIGAPAALIQSIARSAG